MGTKGYTPRGLLVALAILLALSGCRLSISTPRERVAAAEAAAAQVTAVPTQAITTAAPTQNPTSPPTEAPTSQVQDTPELPTPTATLGSANEEEVFDAAEALIIQAYEKVSPSVVHITSRVISMDFFGGLYPSEGTGSGFVMDKQGHIVTNDHVVEEAQTIEVTLLDGTVAEAEIVGLDPLNDLAVIRVDVAPEKLHPVDMSFEGKLKVGQRAIAIGNPFRLDWTLTAGVISSLGRPLQISANRIIYDVIQTDAAINPGNSGGPLLNSRGQLIGVNAAIRTGAENIGFAIPLSTVRRVIPELIENGRYRHPWIGASGYSLFPELAQELGLPVEKGVLIARVTGGGPADLAGLREATREVVVRNTRLLVGGDIIVAFDGIPIGDNAALREYLETRTRVGQEIEVRFYRGEQVMTARVRLGERPVDER